MNKLRFVLEMVDRISGPTRRAMGSLQRFRATARRVGGELATLGSLTHMLYAQRLGKLHDGLRAVANSSIVNGLNRITDSLMGVARMGALAGAAFAGFVGGAIIKGVATMAAHIEKTKLALTSITGSEALGGAEFKKSADLARKFGLNIREVQKEYVKLRAMQFTEERATTFVKLGADLRGAGLTDDEGYKRFLRAATQVQAKGRLQAEELNQQFSEAGVSVDLVLKALQKPLGVKDNKSVLAAITAGKVDADMGLGAVEQAVLQKLNMSQAGELGGKALNTVQGLWSQVKNAPDNLFFRVVEGSGAGIDKLKMALRGVVDMIDRIDPNKIAAFTSEVFGGLVKAIPKIEDFMSGFGEGFSEVMQGFKDTTGDIDFRRVGQLAAKAIGVLGDAVMMAGRAFAFFQTPAGEFTAWTGVAVLGLGKVVGVAAGLVGGVKELWTVFGKAPGADKLTGAFAVMIEKGKVLLPILASIGGMIGVITAGVAAWARNSESARMGSKGSLLDNLSGMWNQGAWDDIFGGKSLEERVGGAQAKAANNAKPSEAVTGALASRTFNYNPNTTINVDGTMDAEKLARENERALRNDADRMALSGVFA